MFKSQIFALSLFLVLKCTFSKSVSGTKSVTQSPDNLATPWGTLNDGVANGKEFLEKLLKSVGYSQKTQLTEDSVRSSSQSPESLATPWMPAATPWRPSRGQSVVLTKLIKSLASLSRSKQEKATPWP